METTEAMRLCLPRLWPRAGAARFHEDRRAPYQISSLEPDLSGDSGVAAEGSRARLSGGAPERQREHVNDIGGCRAIADLPDHLGAAAVAAIRPGIKRRRDGLEPATVG